jgi:hypothetical protein
MAATDRTVRHLRLRSPSEAMARRLVTTLEDALRCASLGDEGARLVVVKRLALGRVADGISSQALSRLIEQRIGEAALHWVEADADEAPAVPGVAFAGRLHARTALALRLLREQDLAAWYWPLAVPEFEPRDGGAANLRRVAWTIAGWPEARAALSAWIADLVRADLGARLAVAIGEAEGRALLHRAGLASPVARTRSRPEPEAAQAARVQAAGAPFAEGGAAPPPLAAWITQVLGLIPPAPRGRPAGSALRTAPTPDQPLQPSPHADRGPDGAVAANAPVRSRLAVPSASRASEGGMPVPEADAPQPLLPRSPGPPPRPASTSATSKPAAEPEAPPWLPSTSCGGLLFLLPVLERCGWPAWCGDTHAAAFTAGVLHRALQRVRAPADDPLWELAPPLPHDLPALPHPAPASWSLLLADAEGERLATALANAPGADAQAAVWLRVARRWLQRAARLGLVRLVRRPARAACTPTHADLHFALAQADLRLRRLGLDLDPGWLPWFGRVVGFHFGAAA